MKDAADFGLPPWPAEEAFPLTAEECLALCKGNAVRLRGGVETFLRLPFRAELLNGCLLRKRE